MSFTDLSSISLICFFFYTQYSYLFKMSFFQIIDNHIDIGGKNYLRIKNVWHLIVFQ